MRSFSKNIIAALLILMIIAGLYSLLSGQLKQPSQISLSQLVSDINAGKVKSIKVSGDNIEITYQDNTVKTAQKETESSFSQTLANYGVSKDQLNKANLSIDNSSGLAFWVGTVLPFFIPLLIIVFLFWMAARQVKNTSLQAFSFGKSRARIISPDDKKERITFKDVAGVQEAKEELKEIVEFLKES